jgi:hypothetical protein
MDKKDPFIPRSFTVPSPTGRQRIYTTLSPCRLLLTADAAVPSLNRDKGILMSIQLDDSPRIAVGSHLLHLGIPLFGMVTGLFPVPSVDGVFRVIINYHPLPQPNIRKPQ